MSVTTRSGIPTTYRYANFRSRLEARWAAFFDLVGWRYTYEPLDASGYIPDFLIHGPIPFFVEVGPCITKADYEAKSAKPDMVTAELGHDVLVVGVTPIADLPLVNGELAAGLLGEFVAGHRSDDCPERWLEPTTTPCDHSPVYVWDTAVWGMSPPSPPLRKSGFGIYHTWSSYLHRPDGVAREWPLPARERVRFEALWAEAGNRVQWRAA